MSKSALEVECPECGAQVSLTEAITHEIGGQFKEEYQEKISRLQASFDEKQKQLLKETAEQAKNEALTEIKDLKNQIDEQSEKLHKAQEQELAFRKQQRELDEKEKNLSLEIQRKTDEHAAALKREMEKDSQLQIKLLEQTRDLKEESLRKKIEELNQKLLQGSQQTQGEVFEVILEQELAATFSSDEIVPVPKGVTGADVIQNVCNQSGQICGSIIWESKRTKNWSAAWIQKLKDDQRQVKADVAILLSQALPEEVKGFAQIDGVWVCDIHSYQNLCRALRLNLLQVNAIRQANVGKNDKMEALYQYLSGTEFKQRVLTIVEAFENMKQDLNKERTAMQKHWAKREKEIDRVIGGTVGMYGDLEGLIGSQLPRIKGLDLLE